MSDEKKRVVILANGVLNEPEMVRETIRNDDIILAADGGTLHALELNLLPHIVIGDFDSLDEIVQTRLRCSGVKLIQHPAQKDETDLELAVLYACQLGATDIIIFAALGARWDMTVANILLLTHPEIGKGYPNTPSITIRDGNQDLFLIRPGYRRTIHGNIGDTVSLIPMMGDVQGVVTQGLGYPLYKEILRFGTTRGISNVVQNENIYIKLEAGLLLCVVNHTIHH